MTVRIQIIDVYSSSLIKSEHEKEIDTSKDILIEKQSLEIDQLQRTILQNSDDQALLHERLHIVEHDLEQMHSDQQSAVLQFEKMKQERENLIQNHRLEMANRY